MPENVLSKVYTYGQFLSSLKRAILAVASFPWCKLNLDSEKSNRGLILLKMNGNILHYS
jgi:hypothetical protein